MRMEKNFPSHTVDLSQSRSVYRVRGEIKGGEYSSIS
jgi:hypothetical protein